MNVEGTIVVVTIASGNRDIINTIAKEWFKKDRGIKYQNKRSKCRV